MHAESSQLARTSRTGGTLRACSMERGLRAADPNIPSMEAALGEGAVTPSDVEQRGKSKRPRPSARSPQASPYLILGLMRTAVDAFLLGWNNEPRGRTTWLLATSRRRTMTSV